MDFYTDNQEINNVLDARIGTLPEVNQIFLHDQTLTKILTQTCLDLGLSEDDILRTHHEVALVLMEFDEKENFINNLTKEINASSEITTQLGEWIDENIFSQLSPDTVALKENETANIESAPPEPTTEEVPVDPNPTPRYARPLTDMPQYSDADPYREKLE